MTARWINIDLTGYQRNTKVIYYERYPFDHVFIAVFQLAAGSKQTTFSLFLFSRYIIASMNNVNKNKHKIQKEKKINFSLT